MWVQLPGPGISLGDGNGSCSSILVCRIPWTVEPGGLQSIGSQRVRLLKWFSTHACILSKQGERKMGCKQLRVEGMIFRKDEWTRRRTDGKSDSLWQSCLSMKWTSTFFFCDKSQPPVVDETPKEASDDRCVHFGGSVFGKSRQVRESLFLLFSQVPLHSK